MISRWLGLCVLAVWASCTATLSAEEFPLEIRTTEIIRGPQSDPRAVLDVTLRRALDGEVQVEFLDANDGAVHELELMRPEAGSRHWVPVPLPEVGQTLLIKCVVQEGGREHRVEVQVPRPADSWVIHFVPGFHYDPVWWNTQAHYTETGRYMDSHVGPGHSLMNEYLDMCNKDPDYRVALHQLPYLKTWLESYPDRAEDLFDNVRAGRCGLVGGSYNEYSSTLVNSESSARNAIYGVLFQRNIVKGKASVFWQCDVFGHDPSFPTIMTQTAHDGGGFARGPFHQWGAPRDQVNFPSEFYWMSPDGSKILTHYMTGHYGYAYAQFAPGSNRAPDDPVRSNAIICHMFEDLRQPALTHHVLLPMHTDFIRPLENLGDVVRAWNRTYLSPRAEIDTSEGFFDAVRREIAARRIPVPVITRDMNPIYTGCPVSFADLKLANRACENRVREAEIFATWAALEGARYPSLSIDRCWRQLLFNAHHDGVTGSMSDQVYLDIMMAYRDCLEIATEVRDRAIAFLARRVDTRDLRGDLMWNSVAWQRSGTTAAGKDWFVDVPAVGYAPSYSEPPQGGSDPQVLENEFLRVELDPARGGCLSSIRDKKTGRELLRGLGNDLVVHQEYPVLPGHGEGPWHLAPTGERRSGTNVKAEILPVASDAPHQRVVTATYPEFSKRQTITLRPGSRRIDFRSEILDWRGRNQLVRVEFPLDLPGTRPIYQTSAAVIGRPFARDVDTAKDSWTLDQVCWQWAGLGSVCTIEVQSLPVEEEDKPAPGAFYRRALGVGEIVLGDLAEPEVAEAANRIAEAFVQLGVTTTITREGQRRYGDLEYDSNVPDFRVLFGDAGREHRLLQQVTSKYSVPNLNSPFWIDPGGDELPLLLIKSDRSVLENFLADLRSYNGLSLDVARTYLNRDEKAPKYGAYLINQGAVSVHAKPDGNLGINLMRSCTSWPSGIWIDPPARRLPDGSPMGTMHGSHEFDYSLVLHDGDYRDANASAVAQEVNHPIITRFESPHEGVLPPRGSLLSVDTPGVVLTALKVAGFPEAEWRQPSVGAPRALVARFWNGTGRTVAPRVQFERPIRDVWKSNLLEERLEQISVTGNEFALQMRPHELATVVIGVVAEARNLGEVVLDPKLGDVAPTAFWLENLGEGVTGNGMVTLSPDRRLLELDSGGGSMRLSVCNHRAEVPGEFELEIQAPESLAVELDPRRVRVGPEERSPVVFRCEAGADYDGEPVLVTVTGVGVQGNRIRADIWVRAKPAQPSDWEPAHAVVIENAKPVVSQGDALVATLINRTNGPISGQATWLSPYALWSRLRDWTQPVTIPAGGRVEIRAPLSEAIDSFSLLRFGYGGTVVYGESVAILRDPESVLLSFGVDRVRLRADRVANVRVEARGLGALEENDPLQLTVPEPWSTSERSRTWSRDEHGVARLVVDYDVTADEQELRGSLRAQGPKNSSALVSYTVSPEQTALPLFEAVVPDARLDEWDDAEFTQAQGPLSNVRTAVRYGASGLAVAMVVEDDKFVQTHVGATIWMGDSMQFSLSVSPATAMGYGTTDLEFGTALTPNGPIAWCWYGGDGGQTGKVAGAEVAVVSDGQRLIYEVRLPRSAFPKIALEPGAILGFSYIANDDDGEGYRGATEWTAGMTGTKDASLFGELRLLKQDN